MSHFLPSAAQQPAAICALKTPGDAIMILEAARQGLVPRVTRRLTSHERMLIGPGTVWVWEEQETNMRRWTDGRRWGASRVGSGGFLIYTESSDSLPPIRMSSDSPPHSTSHPYLTIAEPLLKQTYTATMTDPHTSRQSNFHIVAYSSKHNPQGEADKPLPGPHELYHLASLQIPPGIWPDLDSRPDRSDRSDSGTSSEFGDRSDRCDILERSNSLGPVRRRTTRRSTLCSPDGSIGRARSDSTSSTSSAPFDGRRYFSPPIDPRSFYGAQSPNPSIPSTRSVSPCPSMASSRSSHMSPAFGAHPFFHPYANYPRPPPHVHQLHQVYQPQIRPPMPHQGAYYDPRVRQLLPAFVTQRGRELGPFEPPQHPIHQLPGPRRPSPEMVHPTIQGLPSPALTPDRRTIPLPRTNKLTPPEMFPHLLGRGNSLKMSIQGALLNSPHPKNDMSSGITLPPLRINPEEERIIRRETESQERKVLEDTPRQSSAVGGE
ncbi:hypothetical protein M231_04252 [Tremella mesenterica]|uniref:cAMP-independent regulatory protein pac2 n=1 Tax=Tremella mesenterica TaxID=5217 RepID=A0A4Q1BL83_TREME|nr:uncharacterized protein TREMEDRAFT_66127 [Tremella mesenterica DSM 1558]EIW65752.1 hypothetical protein TREMEDRAFT_66127 [Tremella mesenterica DSM 1558]RXK38486.1 hypothetical protein M231_04252 [Tremella mesenterica]